MPNLDLSSDRSVLVIVDVQEALVKALDRFEPTLRRIEFLAKMAELLEVPILATEQNPSRMGSTHPSLARYARGTISKMSFSACGSSEFLDALKATGRSQ